MSSSNLSHQSSSPNQQNEVSHESHVPLRFVMIDNYDSFTFNLVQYFQTLGVEVMVVRNDEMSVESLLHDSAADAFVISPGPSTPNEAGISLDLVKSCFENKKPLLGVCLGHQTIGQAFGARIITNDVPVHGKVSSIFHQNEGVFRDLPNPVQATRYHSLIIDRKDLPDCLHITASLEADLQGIIMGVRHRDALIEGVQFHPESVLTDLGLSMLENFVEEVRSLKRAVPQAPVTLEL
jgi:anthranilate synthase/aminodeoxychorismate synthase-like glutamine amidotransferase